MSVLVWLCVSARVCCKFLCFAVCLSVVFVALLHAGALSFLLCCMSFELCCMFAFFFVLCCAVKDLHC